MIRVNVGLSRKLSKDCNSTGFSINLEGEIIPLLDDPEAVIEKIREYYDLADEALRDQIERYESTSAIAARDEPSDGHINSTVKNGKGVKGSGTNSADTMHTNNGVGGSGSSKATGTPASVIASEEKATNKQVQFLLTLAKRQGLTLQTLETRAAEILGRRIGTYDLTKRQAGQLIESLNPNSTTAVGTAR